MRAHSNHRTYRVFGRENSNRILGRKVNEEAVYDEVNADAPSVVL